jgi:hypothetical protein
MLLASSRDSGYLTKNEVVCFVNCQTGVCRAFGHHVALTRDYQIVNLICCMFIITVPKLAVDEMVVSVVPELGKLSNPIKVEALF